MFGMRHGSECEGRWAAGRGWRRRHGFGGGGRHGMGGGDMIRAGRMLATGDLRLIALALIAEEPRHGYEIIKVLEEKTAGWYSPSPGIVYPTLTHLEEAGSVTAQAEGAKTLYTITAEGRAYLAETRDFVDAVLDRLAAVGRKIARMRRRFQGEEREEGPKLTRLVRAALEDLRDEAGKRLEAGDEAKIVEILTQAAAKLRSR